MKPHDSMNHALHISHRAQTWMLVLSTSATIVRAAAIDFGPTYGRDYAGMDYNCTNWNSPSNNSANHWYASMQQCEALCLAAASCCTWTYVTPETGPADPERCCLKFGVPIELNGTTTHWTGAAPRAVTQDCIDPPGPPYPGPAWAVPKLHNSPSCLHEDGWHDIAGAIVYPTSLGQYHVWQGCPVAGGWHHASSDDLVHWTNQGVQMLTLPEPYGSSSPCSGFVTVDDDGQVCAGFRECSGNWPGRPNQQVPLELRCALDANLTTWSAPEYIFWFYFNRPLPYDPVRPWKGGDGNWYATIAADGCNTTSAGGCAAGGREYLYTSPRLHGSGANWTTLGPMWTSNYTVLTPVTGAWLDRELVTVDYMGAFEGDPTPSGDGFTRVLTNNVCGNGCCDCTTGWYMGTQRTEGGALVVDVNAANATGMIDWGSFAPSSSPKGTGVSALDLVGGGAYRMARTLSVASTPGSPGDDANQVAVTGRRIMVSWLSAPDGTASQSLPRDLTLSPNGTGLLQQFSPELQALRVPGSHTRVHGGAGQPVRVGPTRGLQLELYAIFSWTAPVSEPSPFGVCTLACDDGSFAVCAGVDVPAGIVYLHDRAGPLLPGAFMGVSSGPTFALHLIVDAQIATVLANNATGITRFAPPPDASCIGTYAFGDDQPGLTVTIDSWALAL